MQPSLTCAPGRRAEFRPAAFEHAATVAAMKLLRRALGAFLLAGTIAGAMRTRGRGGTPPQEGGWREVEVPPR